MPAVAAGVIPRRGRPLRSATRRPLADTDRQTRTVALPPGRGLLSRLRLDTSSIEGSSRADARSTSSVMRHLPTDSRASPSRSLERGGSARPAVQTDGGTDPAYRTDVTLKVPEAALVRSVRIVEGRLVLSSLHGFVTADSAAARSRRQVSRVTFGSSPASAMSSSRARGCYPTASCACARSMATCGSRSMKCPPTRASWRWRSTARSARTSH